MLVQGTPVAPALRRVPPHACCITVCSWLYFLGGTEDIALEVTLRDVLKNVGDDRSRTRPAYILVRKVADRWQPALVLGDRYNANYGLGFVRSAELSDDTITITFGGHISDDPWVKGGWGNWSVSLSKQANGEWSGTHTGLFAAQPVSGTAHARVDVLPPVDQASVNLANRSATFTDGC